MEDLDPQSVDLNSPHELLFVILKQVRDTPCEPLLLHILQHLVQVDPQQKIWTVTERLVHRVSLCTTPHQADQLLRVTPPAPLAAPPPAPPLPQMSAAPPPPPLQPLTFAQQLNMRSKNLPSNNAAQMKPIGQAGTSGFTISGSQNTAEQKEFVSLPQQKVPQPSKKLKTLAWNKVPTTRVTSGSRNNIWMKTAAQCQSLNIDFRRIDDWFGVKITQPSAETFSPSRGVAKPAQVHLLAPKRSLNVNIFLKQFRKGVAELLALIDACDNRALGIEKLRGLAKILPSNDEIENLNTFKGAKETLASAEQFFIELIIVKDYRLKVEGMLLKEEYASLTQYIRPAIDALILAGQDILACRPLHQLLYMTLMIGNYLNAGGYGGNAAGFKVSSLSKLIEMRSNKPNATLLHLVATEAQAQDIELLQFPQQLKFIEGAAKLSVETVRNDLVHLRQRTEQVHKQITDSIDPSLSNSISAFILQGRDQLKMMQSGMEELERLRVEVAEFFCEDSPNFKLEECCAIFHMFCIRFTKAVQDNLERQERPVKMRSSSMDGINRMRASSDQSTTSSLASKYQGLCSGRDITLTAYIEGNNNNNDVTPNSGNSGTDLMKFLHTSSGGGAYSCGSITNRSGKRRGSQESRERNTSWRERVETLLHNDEEANSKSNVSTAPNLSIDKPCTPTQIRPTPPPHNSTPNSNGEVHKQPRTWVIKRSERAKKTHSLHGSGSDLGQLLDENIQADQVFARRTNIDDVVRHCEKTKAEIDTMNLTTEHNKNIRDSGIEHDVDENSVDVYMEVRLTSSSDEAPRASSKESDEGFDTESYSTICSSDQLDIKPNNNTTVKSGVKSCVVPKSKPSPVKQASRNISSTTTPNRAINRPANPVSTRGNVTPRRETISSNPRTNLTRKFADSTHSLRIATQESPVKKSEKSVPVKKELPKKSLVTAVPRTTKVTPKPETRPALTKARVAPTRRPLPSRLPPSGDTESTSSADSPPQLRRKPMKTVVRSVATPVQQKLVNNIVPKKNVWNRLANQTAVKKETTLSIKEPITAFGNIKKLPHPVTKAWK